MSGPATTAQGLALVLAFLTSVPTVASRARPRAAVAAPAGQLETPAAIQGVQTLIERGDHAAAATRSRELLAEAGRAHGAGSLEAAQTIDVLVEALDRGGESSAPEALELARRAVAIKQALLDPADPRLAESLDRLGRLLHHHGRLEEAKGVLQRTLAIREEHLDPQDLALGESLRSLASVLADLGEYETAEALYAREAAIVERSLGPEHVDVARSLYNHAGLLVRTAKYDDAEALYQRALAITQKRLGPDHARNAWVFNGLAILHDERGDYVTARPLYERALAIAERSLGPDDPFVASCLNNLGLILRNIGDFQGANQTYARALEIAERRRGPDHPYTAGTLRNLADVRHLMGDYAGAEGLYRRALRIRERSLGPNHPEVATTLHGLGKLLADRGEPARARALYERALRIGEANLGADHPDLGWISSDLANLLFEAGEHAAARSLYGRALEIAEKGLGADHPGLAEILRNLALLLAETNEDEAALRSALRAEAVSRDHARVTSVALPERQALSYASVRATGLDVALSIAARRPNDSSVSQAWDSLIQSRALVLDEMASRHQIASSAREPDMDRLLERLASTSRRLATLTLRKSSPEQGGRYRELLEQARADSERAERDLAARSLTFRAAQARRQIGLAEVRAGLAPDEALVAYVVYAARDTLLARRGEARNADRPNDPAKRPHPIRSYAALVLSGKREQPRLVPLGAADEVDALVSDWRHEASRALMAGGPSAASAERACREKGDALRQRLWDPIAPSLSGVRRVVVVPDGAIHLVNFYALPSGASSYLVETALLIRLASVEREIAPGGRTPLTGRGLLVLGGPAFDEVPRGRDPGAKRTEIAAAEQVAVARSVPANLPCADLQSMRFEALPGSAAEAREVAALWSRAGQAAVHLSGFDATEAAFKAKAPGRRILHLATHGFFLGGACTSRTGGLRGVASLTPGPRTASTGATLSNPLLLSGLALAGANRQGPVAVEEEDGILTALEIASLDLSGMDSAVLSACDTAVGRLEAGEGVLGLRRAFGIAGARTVVMSLWPVADQAARDWMTAFYEAHLLGARDAHEALKDASLRVLNNLRAKDLPTHPFSWGGWVAAGVGR